ncbi:hypothetical protein [uncultured phage]|nr:hypothetical protein [uncultured phage]CAD8327842.1 hypothetical protein [uncultured phage]CAD8327845.1 hypothetical protein [uncultured phage]
MDTTTRIVNLEKQNLELLQLLESIEVMLSQGNSITPKSFIIRGAIQMALGIENKESINKKLKTK